MNKELCRNVKSIQLRHNTELRFISASLQSEKYKFEEDAKLAREIICSCSKAVQVLFRRCDKVGAETGVHQPVDLQS